MKLRDYKVAVFGATGYIGRNICACLNHQGNQVIEVSSRSDLSQDMDRQHLIDRLKECDAIISAMMVRPELNNHRSPSWSDVFEANHRLGNILAAAADEVACPHVIYLSSDSVYPYGNQAVREQDPAAPLSAYAQLHMSMENLLSDSLIDRLTICRLTQVYGAESPSSAYGPKQMVRDAILDKRIKIFGEGEEYRNHVTIQTVLDTLVHLISKGPMQLLNVASSRSLRFIEIANKIVACDGQSVIERRPRKQKIIHRHVDVSRLKGVSPLLVQNDPLEDVEDLFLRVSQNKSTGID